MIRYSLICVGDHPFEAWFSNSAAYDEQRKKRQVLCPVCGSARVSKQIMAPAVRPSRGKSGDAESAAALAARAAGEIRQHISQSYAYVGERFAEEARAMHSGEAEDRPVWGQVTPDVARELAEEGVPAIPIPPPFAPEPPRPKDKLN